MTIKVGLTTEQYHADTKAIGKSGLDYIARSPAHYYAAYLDPHREYIPPTPAQALGTAWHMAVLEPDKYEQRVVAAPRVDRRSKAGKEAYAAFVSANAGAIIIDQDDHDRIRRMRDAMLAHPAARVLIKGGVAEHCYYATCPETGMQRKCRPDYIRPDGVIVDLKSTEDARPSAFSRSCWNYRYYVQAPWYLDVCGDAIDGMNGSGRPNTDWQRPHTFIFLVQEKSPPFSVMVYEAQREFIDVGRMEAARNMATYAACVRDNYWPSYPEEILPIELPSWAVRTAARMPA